MSAWLQTLTRSRFARNWVAVLTTQYGSQAIELAIIMVAMRTVGSAEVGQAFLAHALASVAFRLLDLGLYPVFMRRTARGQLGRRALREATLFRAAGVGAISVVFFLFAFFINPDDAALLTAFFFANGLAQVHEVPRAVLAGSERFDLNARNGLITKFVEMLLSIAGMFAGVGIVSWCIGRTLGQLALCVWSYFSARTALPLQAPDSVSVPMPREGLPFWFRRVLYLGSQRLDTILVTAFGGYEAAALLGVANRIIHSGTGITVSLSFVAFPSLARREVAEIRRVELWTLVGVSAAAGIAVYAGAPLLLWVIMGDVHPVALEVVRCVAPAVFLMGISRPLELWLEATGAETALARVSVLAGVVALGILAVLVPAMGTVGAAWSRVGRSVVDVTTMGALAHWSTRHQRRSHPR